jgi:DNA-binding GntR family transcriptional regulator
MARRAIRKVAEPKDRDSRRRQQAPRPAEATGAPPIGAARLLRPLPRPRTIAEEVAERIVLAIANGEQEPGERLTEEGLAEVMDVSRVPAREALHYLEAIGIVVPLRRRGLRIIDFSPQQAREINEVRLGLESVAVKNAMALVRQDPARLKALDAILSDMHGLLQSADAIALALADVAFHREIMTLSENPFLLKFWEGLAPHLVIIFCRDWHADRRKVAQVALHRRLRQLVARGEPEDIEAVLIDHFGSPVATAAGR